MTTILEKTAGLIAFIRTADTGSFTAAARLLGVSPSAISKSVARLEKRLGCRLIQRSTRTLTLTAEGTAYFERVGPLLRALEEAEDVVQETETARGLLRITVPVIVGRSLMPGWVAEFTARYPEMKVELNISDRHADLIREGFDLAIRVGKIPDSDLMVRKLAVFSTALVAAPAYLARHGAPKDVDDLHNHACLHSNMSGRTHGFRFGDGTQRVFDGPFSADDGIAIREAAVAGAGIAQMPRFILEDQLNAGSLVEVLSDVDMIHSPLHVLHPFGRQLPLRARVFIDFLVERCERCW